MTHDTIHDQIHDPTEPHRSRPGQQLPLSKTPWQLARGQSAELHITVVHSLVCMQCTYYKYVSRNVQYRTCYIAPSF